MKLILSLRLLAFFLIIRFLCFLCFIKIKHYAVDTIAQSRGWRTIFKYMSEVRFATTALYLGTAHAQRIIGCVNNAALADRFVKTWPAATAFKFGIAFKQRIATSRAIVSAFIKKVFILACPWPLRSFLPCDMLYVSG